MLPKWVYELAEKVLMKSIEYPTVLGDSYKEIVEYYSEVLKKYGIHTTIYRVEDEYLRKVLPESLRPEKPRYILLAKLGSGDKVIQFNGHYDVVAPGAGWKITDPFKPKKIDNKIYGRGSTDMKGGIAAFVAAMAYLASSKEPLDHVVEAAIVPDEEIGGETGTGYLVDKLGSRPDWVIIAEPSGIDTIWIGHKGAVWAEVIVKGKQTHGSTPWLGINAFEKMVYVAKYLIEEVKPVVESRRSKYTYDMPESAKATMNLGGKLTAPGSINIVPGQVSFSIDRRVIVEENVDDVEKELISYIKQAASYAKADVDIKIVTKLEPALTDPQSTLTRTLENTIQKILGKQPRKVVCTGGLDLHYYTSKGIQAVSYGPGDSDVAHQVDEYIVVDDLYKAIEVYVEFSKNKPG
ncbi:M20 family metallopeptidase [Desulfurococcaceae archaeon MEX13E-LK6-19]|nr:M20 family metallopeptidase [Desulfurococcaceae archaeon MEX13E-LK6-19]